MEFFINSFYVFHCRNLRGNNFSKPFPQLLLNKAKSGVLKFDYDGGTDSGDACQSDESCNNKKTKKSIVVPIAAAGGGVLLIICATMFALFFIRSRKPKATFKIVDAVDQERRFIEDPNSTPMSQISNHNNVIIASNSRQFTYHQVLQITNNFKD
ncbi:hypothetical protein LIER_30618 [Lithospermum erythrorhizon]|uniref:Uncharacterized protein n=1 Tax=Lithospermum erythrorhizon TaxID=34254 RepID=A0AAV3RTJ0_LITER